VGAHARGLPLARELSHLRAAARAAPRGPDPGPRAPRAAESPRGQLRAERPSRRRRGRVAAKRPAGEEPGRVRAGEGRPGPGRAPRKLIPIQRTGMDSAWSCLGWSLPLQITPRNDSYFVQEDLDGCTRSTARPAVHLRGGGQWRLQGRVLV